MSEHPEQYFIIDFDSTFIRFEALDELAAIALKDQDDRDERLRKIKEYTNRAMNGQLGFPESLEKRIRLLDAGKEDIEKLVRILKRNISTSIRRNEAFFKKYADRVYIISGGFKEYIAPVVSEYNIPENQIFANTFTFDAEGRITGFDKENYLAQENGKVKQLRNIDIEGEVYVIGDGYTDYQLKESGLADKFFNFTENIERVNLLDKADHITPSFDEFLFKNKLPMSISYPKNRIRAYVMENIPQEVVQSFEREGYQVETMPARPTRSQLKGIVAKASILAIHPETVLSGEDLQPAKRLLAIGVYGSDRGNIDLQTCLKKGIIVLHAPHTNTRSVAELAVGEMIMLMRRIKDHDRSVHSGRFDPTGHPAYELHGKTLGIVGYGKVGKQLGTLAEGLGMEVIFHDTVPMEGLGNAHPATSFEDLLEASDVVSVHVTDSDENHHLINENTIDLMKDRVVFLNLSCERVVDQKALADAIKKGKILGAGIDRFETAKKPEDKNFVSPLQNLQNVFLTPTISGNTRESRFKTAEFVTTQLINFINSGDVETSVNFPDIQLPPLDNAHRLIHIHEDHPGMMAEIARVLAEHEINIVAQFLKTSHGIGYLITDISKGYDDRVIKAIKRIPYAIRLRILY